MSAAPADAVALALGITGETAADLALAADDPEPELARAANQALWPATWGSWLTDPMSIAGAAADRPRADRRAPRAGSSTTSGRRAAAHPAGRPPAVRAAARDGLRATRRAAGLLEHLENFLLDLLDVLAERRRGAGARPRLRRRPARRRRSRSRRPRWARSTARPRTSASSGCARSTTPSEELSDLYDLRLGLRRAAVRADAQGRRHLLHAGGPRHQRLVPDLPRARAPRPGRRGRRSASSTRSDGWSTTSTARAAPDAGQRPRWRSGPT